MMSVLFVDDSPVFRDEACVYFARNGWKTEATGDGKTAIEILSQRAHEFDAVVLDRAMPVLEGDEVLRWMRRQPNLTDTCVVIVTKFGGLENAIEMLKLGAFHYLKKAVDLGNLQDVLRAGIAWHRAHKMRRELLKTLDSSRILSGVVNVIRDALGSNSVHPIFLRPDGRMQRVAVDGITSDETPRRFIGRICAGELAIFEEKRDLVSQLDPFVKGAGSLVAVPIMGTQNQVRGVLEVESDQETAFSQSWVEVLRYLADLIGIGLEVGKEAERLAEVYRDLRHNIATHVQIVGIQARRIQQLIANAPNEPAELMRDHVRFIVDNAAIIEKAVQDIKAIVVEPRKPQLELTDIVELAKNLLKEQTPKFEELDIESDVEPANGSIFLNTDRESLTYCLRCLINNAAESIEDNRTQNMGNGQLPKGRIHFSVEEGGAFVGIKIHDTGIGFGDEIATKLFMPIFSTKGRRLPKGQKESTGIERVERLLELMRSWCRQDPRSATISKDGEYEPLGRGMELFIRDNDAVDMYIGHHWNGGLDLHNLEGSSICHVGTDSPLAAEWFGRGEGLFSVRKYVTRLEGTVSGSSPGIGQGATFTITLPKSA